ncbi:MAG: hypothetical protein JSS00_06795 [Proteobacteria bacterium]|nr:hypothetical protein [Pseudomonadota bacterium]
MRFQSGSRVFEGVATMRLWRLFFCVAALNNLVIGGVMLFNADQAAARIGVAGPAAGYTVGFGGLLIAIFGLAYALVAYRPLPNRNLVAIGALSKASTVVFASWHAMAGHIPQNVYLISMGDLAFAAIFAIFLLQTRNAQGATP